MPIRSPHLEAAIRAIQGESDVETVRPAFADWQLTRIIALAPDANRIMRSLAALFLGENDLLSPSNIDDPALHETIARMIGTNVGYPILASWAQIAPAGRGRAYAAALIDAVNDDRCSAGSAAALIGPCDEAAALLTTADAMSFAIRRWGQSTPATPTAWMDALSPRNRKRLLHEAPRDPLAVSFCLPWLPPDLAKRMRFDSTAPGRALDAFVEASPIARAQHADLLQRLVAQAQPEDSGVLAKLACVIEADEVWQRVVALVQETADAVVPVVTAVPWNDLPETVQSAILNHASQSGVYAAVAAARGRTRHVEATAVASPAFFAALDPNVWDALDIDERQRWLNALWGSDATLAIRAVGLRPEVLTRKIRDDALRHWSSLVRAVRCHAHDVDDLCWALLPFALHSLPPDAAHDLIAALPTPPPDPGMFFFIASKSVDPAILPSACTTLRSPDNLARAVALQRSVDSDATIRDRCAALHDALRGRSWNDIEPIVSVIDIDARTVIIPDPDELSRHLARPNQQEKMRQTLARFTSLPPQVAIPTCVALSRRKAWEMSCAAEAIADALRAYGDIFLAIVETIADNGLRAALLPFPDDHAQANALRALARDDPPTAHRLARALRIRDWRAATDIALLMPTHHRNVLTPAPDALVERLERFEQREALRHALDRLACLPPDIDMLVRFALDMGIQRNSVEAARDIAYALRGHSDVFLTMADALEDDYCAALLPLPENAALANALRDVARDDPLTAQRLAYALHNEDWRAARDALMRMPLSVANVWSALGDVERRALVGDMVTTTPEAAALIRLDPVSGIALAAVQSGDDDLCATGFDVLTARADVLRAMWSELPQSTQQFLRAHHALAVAFADIPDPSPSPTSYMRRIR